MKTSLKAILASAVLALPLAAVMSTPAAATCWGCDYEAGFEYGAGGEAENEGSAYGKLTGAWSKSNKEVYGGGDASDSTTGYPKANAYAGSHFSTEGGSMALSGGWGHSRAATSEYGSVMGGGFANAFKRPASN